MPGKKDSVSIQRHVQEQKRLLLCTLNELSALLKNHCPESRPGFSIFCPLRLKRCMIVGVSGIHSVRVCYPSKRHSCGRRSEDKRATKICLICMQGTGKNRICMVHVWQMPRSILQTILGEENDEISCQQWQSTNGTKLVTQSLSADECTDLLIRPLIPSLLIST